MHVPVNQNLTGDDLSYLLAQSGSRSCWPTRPGRRGHLAGDARGAVLPLRDADDSLLARLADGRRTATSRAARRRDLVQLLYTSGTTALPKGAMMTHRALVHEYV